MKKTMTVTFKVRMPAALLKRIDKLAQRVPEELGSSRSDLVRALLVEAMDAREEDGK